MDYNHHVNRSKYFIAFLMIFVMITQTSASVSAAQSAPSGYDLVAEVNAYRLSQGYYALNPQSQVMAAAQAHAEWIVETGQGGHTGVGGSDETMRVAWTGYGGGAAIQCDEAWAHTDSINNAIYVAWSDWTHQEVMLHGWGNPYTDIGGGVADYGDGTYVFVLDICMISGQGSSQFTPGNNTNLENTPNIQGTPDLSNYVFGVVKSTPAADGSIIHIVKPGQTLSSIAEAYGITIDQLRELNYMAADQTDIWPEQKLMIKKGNGTPLATVTGTSGGTGTAAATSTPRVMTRTVIPTLALSRNASITPTVQTGQVNTAISPEKTWGITLIVLCGIGFITMFYFFFLKK